MFKAAINAETIGDVVEATSPLVDEIRLKLSPDGVSLRAVDPANVAMVSLTLDASAFESFECTEGEIGIDLIRFADVLRMAQKDDVIHMEVNEETRKLEIRLGSLSYTLSLLDPSTIRKDPKVPDLELPANVKMPGAEYKRAVKAAEKVSDHMALAVQDNKFVFEAQGDLDRVELTLDASSGIKIETTGDVRSLFSLDFLNDLSKSAGKADEIIIELGSDFPLRMNFSIASGKGKVSYLLAPRIESA